MKKIWLLLLLLLLLIICCVWTKTELLHLNSSKNTAIVLDKNPSTPLLQDNSTMNFEIKQSSKSYTLNGAFATKSSIQDFSEIIQSHQNKLTIEDTKVDKTLTGKAFIDLGKKVLPHFMNYYEEGSIVYKDGLLSVNGTVEDYEVSHEMQRLLYTTTINTQNNTKVIYKKPISFIIRKTDDLVYLDGNFANKEQIKTLKHTIQKHSNNLRENHVKQLKYHVDQDKALEAVYPILPTFIDKYTEGTLNYNGENFTLYGKTTSQETLDEMDNLIKDFSIPFLHDAQVDPKILAQEKAASEKAASEKAASEKAASEKAASEKAASEKAASEKAASEKAASEKIALKTNILDFFKTEVIKFDSAKSTVTKKGYIAIKKLAIILKKYSNIKIELAGHTDSDGSEKFNQRLSQNRVDKIKSILIKEGINSNRLSTKGYGESQPLVPNTNKANKQKNRRVEINIIGE